MKPHPEDGSQLPSRRDHWKHLLESAELRETIARAEDQHLEADKRCHAAEQQALDARNECRELQVALTGLRGELQARNEKIARLQSSASWKLTAPLRALRRLLLDPLNTPKASPPSPAAPAAPLSPPQPQPSPLNAPQAPLWSLDTPVRWDAAPAVGILSGWACWPASQELPTALRIHIDNTELTADLGLPRRDVHQHHHFEGEALLNSGFQLRYRLEPDRDYQVRLEARPPGGDWYCFHQAVLHTSSQPVMVRDYEAWLEHFGYCRGERRSQVLARLEALRPAQRPLISVLMPVYNAPEKWLARAIESVREQLYENWELCIADDASPAPHIRPLLEKFAALDPRIRVVFREKNGHISRASNSALELVRGDFTALLDHDDEIPPDALAEVVFTLADNPSLDILYSDEDKIDEEGRRFIPYFKPDYLPELLTGQNCFSHLSVLRSSLLREIGGFRVGYEGSQDWDLCLRAVEKSSPDRIHHIPRILYHWRAIHGSTALAVSEKSYTMDAARLALLDHFSRRGLPVEVLPVQGSHWRIVYPLPDSPPLVSIVIPTRNGEKLLRRCIGSLVSKTDYPAYEIIVVNNGSDDASALAFLDSLRHEPGLRVLDYNAPFNYSALNNFAVSHASGSVVCLLNNDIEIIDNSWLREMVSHAIRPEIGAVGAMLYYPDFTVQHAGVVLGLGGVANHAFTHEPRGTAGQMNRARLAQNYSAVTAACLVIRKQVYMEVGGLNEKDLAVAFNDIDFCLRVRKAGYRNLWTPFAELLHHESASRGKEDSPEKQARFNREVAYMRNTWGPQLDTDPAYNPNLALSFEGWDLAWPPRHKTN